MSVVKAIILITILCNDGKQDQKKVKNMELGVKKKKRLTTLENDKKCLPVMLINFKSQKGHLHLSQRLNEIFCKEMYSKWHLYY